MEYLLDDYVKSIISALTISGQVDNTVFIFAGDHGSPPIDGFMPENITDLIPGYSRNYPFRGGKAGQWEGGVRCPAFIWSPLLPQEMIGKTVTDITSVMDWLPTMATWAGVSVDSLPNSVDGIDLTDKLFNGGENELRSLLVNINPLCEDYIEERLEHGEDADPQTALRYQAEGVDVKITIDCMLEDGTKIGNISF